MAEIKNLARDTAIYGVSSIVGKFLNWCLFPLYTYTLVTGEYGIVTSLYAWTGVLLVLLTYGMETGFFRFANDSDKGTPDTVYSTCLTSLTVTTALFLILSLLFVNPLSQFLHVEEHPEYVAMMAIIIGLDVFCSLPFAYLRYQRRPLRFMSLKLLNIGLTIILNLFFLVACPAIYKTMPGLISWFYDPEFRIGYIFLANVIASFVMLLTLTPQIFKITWNFQYSLLKQILRYSFPLLILGLAGIMTHNLDKILYPYLIADQEAAMSQLGIYGANTKIAVIMVMFTQAFRYAYEPFVFAKNKGEDKRSVYADAMKYFIIVDLMIFLGVMFYLDIIKHLVSEEYRDGLNIVPIVMMAELFSGVFFNLSIWYKLIDRTHWGAWFSIIGFIIILALNIIFVPLYGYVACAWAAFICYFIIMFLSWIVGQKYYPIKYDLKTIGKYTLLALILFGLSEWATIDNIILRLGFRTVLLLIYVIYLIRYDLPLKEIPYINKLLRRK